MARRVIARYDCTIYGSDSIASPNLMLFDVKFSEKRLSLSAIISIRE